MPDLDLIIQTKQWMRAFGKGDLVALWQVDNAATNAGSLLPICCRSSRRIGAAAMNGCRYC
jgi:hypothetical protein